MKRYIALFLLSLMATLFTVAELRNTVAGLRYETENPDECIASLSAQDYQVMIMVCAILLCIGMAGLVYSGYKLFYVKR